MASNIGHGDKVLPELGVTENITADTNGEFDSQIAQDAVFCKVVVVTSSAATKYVVLPKAKAGLIGRIIYLIVTTNVYELVTPSASGDTINQVDGDGTNHLDVAADTTLRCTQVSATAWLAEQIAATAITVVAPDND